MSVDRSPADNVRALPSAQGYDRVPPHNLDAEVSVLGSMLLSKDAIAEVSELLRPEDFYRGAHRTMFEAMRGLYDRGEPVDAVTLADELERRELLEHVGGVVAITDLLAQVPTAANALYYGRIVADHALRRRLITTGTSITRLGYETATGADEAVDEAEQLMYGVATRQRAEDFRPMKELVTEGFNLIERLYENKSAITGLATGFVDLDELTAGFQPANLVIIAARPSMGKSTLVTNMAAHVAVEQRKPVVLFSLEMGQMELVQRILAAEAKVDSDRLRTGRLHETDWPKLSQAMGRLAEAPIFIDDTAGINLMEIRSKCRRLKQRHGLDLVVVDYLQLMQSHRRHDNRVQEVAEFSRGLKILAKELEVPVIALSQLSRRPEERSDRRPQLSDLRESGCLTADARVLRADTGGEVTMGELHASGERNIPVWAVGPDYRMVRGTMTHVFPTGVKPVFRLRLHSGREVTASANHPFLTLDGWRRLDELSLGMRLAVPRALPASGPVPVDVRLDTIPREVWSQVQASMRQRGVEAAALLAADGSGWRQARADEGAPTRATLARIAAALDDAHLGALAASDLLWDGVVGIEAEGVRPVYDATVLAHHNFVANGIVVENSIEQDADIVCFIYRDEVYDQDSPAKGEAELIVAKHRNGPLRTVRLSFIGHHSRFASMARGHAPPGARAGL